MPIYGRTYSCAFSNVAETATQDLFYLKPAADKPITIEYAEIGVVGGTADAGDAQEELLRVEIIYLPATVTVGSGGSSVTPNPCLPNDTAASFTCRSNDTTPATTSGSAKTLHPTSENNRISWIYDPKDKTQLIVANANAIVIRLNTAPADSIAVNGVCYVSELV